MNCKTCDRDRPWALGGRLGSDDKMHDNSMTSPCLGLNEVMVGAAKEGAPSTTTFTFTPTKTGTFQWNCVIPCDGNGWAMSHMGIWRAT